MRLSAEALKKKANKRVFRKFAEGEEKIEWQAVMTTEVVAGETNPVYLRTYQFSSSNYLQVQMKAEVYQTLDGKVLPECRHYKLLGEAIFAVEDVAKQIKEETTVQYQLRNPKKPGLAENLRKRESKV